MTLTMDRNVPYYDDGPDLVEQGQIKLAEGLTDWEYEDADLLLPFTKGVMIITGDPGSGKDLFGNVIAWKMKRYFGKEVMRDEPPRRLFGPYIPFDRNTINEDLSEMAEISASKDTNKAKYTRMTMLANEWLDFKGNELLRDKVMYITEFSSWMYNRASLSPINIFMGQILRRWRHFDLLVIGSTQLKSELDPKTCLPYVSHEVRCKWSSLRPDTGNYTICKVRSITNKGVVNVGGGIVPYRLDGGAARDSLDGARYFDLYNSKSGAYGTGG